MIARSRLNASIADWASGPESSKDAVRASPPLMIRRMLLRGASCMPTLRLLVTTVSRRRSAIARATASVVVPPVRPTSGLVGDELGGRLADPALLRRMLGGALADRLLDEAADAADPPPRARDRALPLQHDRVAADRRRGDVQLVGQPLDRDRPLGGLDQLEDRAQPVVAVCSVTFFHGRSSAYLTLPATMPSTIQRLRKKTITAGTAIATIAAALIIV